MEPISSQRLAEIAKAYADHFTSPHVWTSDRVLVKRDNSDTEWAPSIVFDITYDHPKLLLPFVLEVLKLDPANEVIEVLSAGPLEDCLGLLGEEVIDEVEAHARANPKFAYLLGGVWKGKMTDEIWARVQSVWDRRGWDGIPLESTAS